MIFFVAADFVMVAFVGVVFNVVVFVVMVFVVANRQTLQLKGSTSQVVVWVNNLKIKWNKTKVISADLMDLDFGFDFNF